MHLRVFLNDLLGRAPHFAFGAGAVKDAIDDVTTGRASVVAVLVPRTGSGGFHKGSSLFSLSQPDPTSCGT
jgi:hypothetical protein